jgi:uncharacterized membrane protein
MIEWIVKIGAFILVLSPFLSLAMYVYDEKAYRNPKPKNNNAVAIGFISAFWGMLIGLYVLGWVI